MNENEIFDAVIDIVDPAERKSRIAELCGDDTGLRNKVEDLVDAADNPDSFLDDPVEIIKQRNMDETQELRDKFAGPGMTIGPYKLLQEIGAGGMGLVFMAEQTDPVQRRVALKVIKPGMDSRQVIARFEAERQALAMMDHPNIAKVLDAGTTDGGLPFFVMELVNGSPITEYCDQEKLTTAQRLELFGDICRAVQHAHQKGIIHRDLKPGNILVTEYDGKPVPKVIDFGVAKATGMQLTEKTLFTEFGQVVGTVEYMSPEQARRNQLDVDTRTDIYSLGIVLYKLLTGETPFGPDRFKKAAWDEMVRIIQNESPQPPSLKVSSSQSLPQIAINRNIDPAKLSSQIRGDLDWIVTKSLEKDRDHRYQSASEFAADVDRHLQQQPVEAAPRNPFDRWKKYVRRNPQRVGWIGAGVGLLIALVWWGVYAEDQLDKRNAQVVRAVESASLTLAQAMESTIGQEAKWETATAQVENLKQQLNSGSIINRSVRQQANEFVDYFDFKKSEREIAVQIEEVVIYGASHQDLKSWQNMEVEIREFFKEHGFDLDQEDPAEIGQKISDHPSGVMWADLLELWIGTRGHMASLGGPALNASIMQPWADAIYVADNDPIRTGIRKFIYAPPRTKQRLDELGDKVDLDKISPRTLAWFGNCYAMIGENEEADRVLRHGLKLYPQDVMLAHDYGYLLMHQKRFQEASRMFHRCLALRDDVPGLWFSLSNALSSLGEKEAAQRALDAATELQSEQR